MSDLIILLPDTLEEAWNWGLTGSGESGSAKEFTQKNQLTNKSFSRLIAVLPGMDVVTKLHTLEGLSAKQRVQAAGFSIEDELAASLDSTHIAFDTQSSRLALCDIQKLQNVNETLGEYGLSADILCADYDCFAEDFSVEYEGRIIVRSESGLGFAVETEMADAILDKNQGIPSTVSTENLLESIAKSLSSGHMPINLRQGRFAKRTKLGLDRYKRLLGLAAVLLIGFFAYTLGQGLYYGNKTTSVQKQIAEIYTTIFPGQDVPNNPVIPVIRAQTDRQGSTDNDFVSLSAVLANSLKEIDGVEVSSLRYDKAKGQLNLSILYGSFEDTEKLKQAILKNGGDFVEGGTRQSGDGLTGDAVLRSGS